MSGHLCLEQSDPFALRKEKLKSIENSENNPRLLNERVLTRFSYACRSLHNVDFEKDLDGQNQCQSSISS